jgi:hypothetical protein
MTTLASMRRRALISTQEMRGGKDDRTASGRFRGIHTKARELIGFKAEDQRSFIADQQ